ncbi:TetR family transcriptional regulator [Nakamurella flavida]|uniref:TetR family transcriptional regulator n=1 Tax=Nakamurella flavida TaxID=363630 RepID=A0A938YNX8_9ACTN|nr:TetR family transcriptional regulator [Nakamurella flavida]MBM9476832.1 TetR family transcriptional regulator [Nakamurella flavida]MDP9778726.1 AcrR family transcriptional regulator [Nakamurella flavida]
MNGHGDEAPAAGPGGIGPADPRPTEPEAGTPRRRDAAGTRRLLLAAARRRFAADGYRSTTVRDISEEAGVNVALIARYFGSKEGLFEACLTGVADDLGNSVPPDTTLAQVPALLAARVGGSRGAPASTQLVLLLRTSGDERAEEIRRDILLTFARRLAGIAGWRPPADPTPADPTSTDPTPPGSPTGGASIGGVATGDAPGTPQDADRLLLRAQIVLSATFGLSLLRATTRLEPLASAGPAELAEPFADLISALLGAPGPDPDEAPRSA